MRITSEELRLTNLIFIEHKKLSEEVPLLEEEILQLKEINRSWISTDSIRRLEVKFYEDLVQTNNKKIKRLTRKVKTRNGALGGLSVGIVILCLIIII